MIRMFFFDRLMNLIQIEFFHKKTCLLSLIEKTIDFHELSRQIYSKARERKSRFRLKKRIIYKHKETTFSLISRYSNYL